MQKQKEELQLILRDQSSQIQSLESALIQLEGETMRFKSEIDSLREKLVRSSEDRDQFRKENQKLSRTLFEDKSSCEKAIMELERQYSRNLTEVQRKSDTIELEKQRLGDKIKYLEEEKKEMLSSFKERLASESSKKELEIKELTARLSRQMTDKMSDYSYMITRQREEQENRSLWEAEDASSLEAHTTHGATRHKSEMGMIEARSKYIEAMKEMEKKYSDKLREEVDAVGSALRNEYDEVVSVLGTQKREAEEGLREKERSIQDLKEKLALMREEMESMATEKKKGEAEMKFLRERLENLEEEKDKVEEKWIVGCREVAVLKNESVELLRAVKQKEESIIRVKEDYTKLHQIVVDTRKKEVDEEKMVKILDKDMIEIKQKLAGLERVNSELNADKQRLEIEKTSLNNIVNEVQFKLEKERKEHLNRQNQSEENIESLQKEHLKKLEDLKKQNQEDIQRMKLEAKSKQENQLKKQEEAMKEMVDRTLKETKGSTQKLIIKINKCLILLQKQLKDTKDELIIIREQLLGELNRNKLWAINTHTILIDKYNQWISFRELSFQQTITKLESDLREESSKLFKTNRILSEKEDEIAEMKEGMYL